MKPFFNKITAGLSTLVLIAITGAMAGIGLFVLALLAVFGLAATGLAFLAVPFLGRGQSEDAQAVPA